MHMYPYTHPTGAKPAAVEAKVGLMEIFLAVILEKECSSVSEDACQESVG